MSIVYGQDTACLTDLGRIDVQVTDPKQLIGERLARRLQTPRGGLAAIGESADFGFNVRQLVNARLKPSDIGTWRSLIEAECLKDEQVQSVSVEMTYAGDALMIRLSVATSAGPFTLTLDVGKLTTAAVFG